MSKEVFKTYSTGDRSERYQDERDHGKPRDRRKSRTDKEAKENKPKVVSLDFLCECGVPVDSLFGHAPSAEQVVLQHEDELERLEQKRKYEGFKKLLPAALEALDESEVNLIRALFFRKVSARKYAQEIGVSVTTVCNRRERILKKIKKFLLK